MPSNGSSGTPGAGSSSQSVHEAISRLALPGKSIRYCNATKPPKEWPSSVQSSSLRLRTKSSMARAKPASDHASRLPSGE